MSTRKEREKEAENERRAAEKAAKKAEIAAKRAQRDAEKQAKKEAEEAATGEEDATAEEHEENDVQEDGEAVDLNAWTEEEDMALVNASRQFPKGSCASEKERWQAGSRRRKISPPPHRFSVSPHASLPPTVIVSTHNLNPDVRKKIRMKIKPIN